MQLFLVRHGDYIPENEDSRKPLTRKGIKDIEEVAAFLKRSRFSIDIFFSSTKTRAVETAQIIRKTVNPKAQFLQKEYLSPHDSTDNIIYDLSALNDNTLIAGHAPFLPRLASRLLTGDETSCSIVMEPGAFLILENDQSGRWHMVMAIWPYFL